jgi:succinate dehydrogenase flavin-adding protein (antitoxin of CptAB toxin-antitoxin module)
MPLAGAAYRKLRWRCMRRGLLELDIALTRFLDTRYADLDDAQSAAFSALVEREDPELLDLLTGRREGAHAVENQVLDMLRGGQ